jgi:hypothetical protein
MKDAEGLEFDELVGRYGSPGDLLDRLISLDPIMKDLMDAARPGLGAHPHLATRRDSQRWIVRSVS